MSGAVKSALTCVGISVALPAVVIIFLFLGRPAFKPGPTVDREISLRGHDSLIIQGTKNGRSEHGFSQRVGYRPSGAAAVEWFGDVSDGAEPQVYQAGHLVVVIDLPAAQLYVRTHDEKWKSMVLIFPNDLGPFPISYYAERNGLTVAEVSRINELGGKRDRKYPTTYIQRFDPETRDLECRYHVDNMSWWPLRFRLSEDGTRLALVEVGSPR